MEKSQSIKSLGAALMVFHSKVEKVKKDAKNPFFKSSYATLSNILEVIAEPLKDAGLTFAQFPDQEGLTTILMHPESGEFIQATNNMQAKANDPQALGSAITYNRRYSLAAVLGLNIDDDDDGNKATHPNGAVNPYVAKRNGTNEFPDDQRPWMNDEVFNKTKERIAAGETDAFEEVNKAFRMKKVYREQLMQA